VGLLAQADALVSYQAQSDVCGTSLVKRGQSGTVERCDLGCVLGSGARDKRVREGGGRGEGNRGALGRSD
jgi:hypothetical protein